MNWVKMQKDVSFALGKKRINFVIDNGYLRIMHGDNILNLNGEWIFDFPFIKDKTYVWDGIRYVIPRRIIDIPLLVPNTYGFFYKRLLGKSELAKTAKDIVMSSELGSYATGEEFLFSWSEEMLNWHADAFPLRILTAETFFPYMLRYAFYDSIAFAIAQKDLSKVFPEYMNKRIHKIVTDGRYVLPLVLDTEYELKLKKEIVINEAYTRGYVPKWYEPTNSGTMPGRKGFVKCGNKSKIIRDNPTIKFDSPKRQGIYIKNAMQSFSVTKRSLLKKPKEFQPLYSTVMVGFIPDNKCPRVHEDAFVISKPFKRLFSGTQNVNEYIPNTHYLLLKKGDIVVPGQQIAVSKEDTTVFFKTKRLSREGKVKEIIEKNNMFKIIIECLYTLEVGDKLASMHGWKGIVGEIYDELPEELDLLVSAKRLTEGTLLEGMITLAKVFAKDREEKLRINYKKFYNKSFTEILSLLNLEKDEVLTTITIPREVNEGTGLGEVEVEVVTLPINIFRLSHNSSDKVYSNNIVSADEGGIWTRSDNRHARGRTIGRDIQQILYWKGYNIIKRKPYTKLADYLKEASALFNIEVQNENK